MSVSVDLVMKSRNIPTISQMTFFENRSAAMFLSFRKFLPHSVVKILKRLVALMSGKWPLSLATYSLKKSANLDTITGKIRYKMAYDRNPIMTMFADKVRVREYVRDVIGEGYLTSTLHVLDSAVQLDGLDLPKEFALKSNHGSGAMILVWGKASRHLELPENPRSPNWDKFLIHPSSFEVGKAISLASIWLNQNYFYAPGRFPEWAYKDIEPKLIIEKILIDKDGQLPMDYKLFVVNGKCEFIQVRSDRFDGQSRDLFTPTWERIEGTYLYPSGHAPVNPPSELEEMISIAEKLASGVDFLRVDLYITDSGVKFGELTNYPDAGFGEFNPPALAAQLAANWIPRY